MMMNPYRAQRMPRRSADTLQTVKTMNSIPEEEKRGRSLAMVYPVKQSFEELYSPYDALYAGTLFKCLEFPFHKGFRI